MNNHKYRVGQTVHFQQSGFGGIRGDVKIERLLPADKSENLYQVQSLIDGHRRVVRESEMYR
jgi:hypothetical protein